MSTHPNVVTIGEFVSDQDVAGDYRLTTNVEGWGSPARRLEQHDMTGRNGVWIAGAFYGARTVVHSGLIECGTSAAAQALADELAALPSGSDTTYTVDHESIGARSVDVRVAVGAEPQWIDDRSFTYTLTLVAEDPFKRATTPVTVTVDAGTSPTVTHSGTFPAEFTATTTSSGTVQLAAGGLQLRATSVPLGTVFDSRDFTVTGSGGEDLYGATEPGSEWPAVDVGAHPWVSTGTADVDLTFYPTFA